VIVAALDPGLIHPAVAIGADKRLYAAERVPIPSKLSKLPIGERVAQVVRLCVQRTLDLMQKIPGATKIDLVVYECPKIYRGAKGKVDPQDLINITLVAGGWAGAFAAYGARAQAYLPSEWIGQIPKSTLKDEQWTSARGQFIGRRLDAAEKAAVGPGHDATDVAGIWLKAADRLERQRVFPGCTEV